MKILFLAQQLPYPLDSGGKIKSFHFLKALSKEHEIVFLSFIRNEKENDYLKELKPFCKRIETSLIKRSFLRNLFFFILSVLTRKSFIITRDFTKDMQLKVNELLKEEKPDIIHIDHLQMAQYVQDLVVSSQDLGKEKRQNTNIKIVLDEHNVEYVIIERIGESTNSSLKKLFSLIESKSLKRFEKEACEKSDLVLTVTDEDKKLLTNLIDKEVEIKTVPIGVDTEYFSLDNNKEKENTIVFIGTMFWPPNVDGVTWFIDKIWPYMKESNIKLQIIGRRPTKTIKDLIEKDEKIELIEYADDIRPYMHKGKVFIVPLRQGSGMRVKILNAFASGIPVVSTIIGAEGIEGLVNKNNILLEDEPRKFAEAVTELINNDNLRETLKNNARRLAQEKYSWDVINKETINIYEKYL